MTEYLTIYKTDEYTLQIVTDESGVVLDCEITFKSTSEYARRIAQRAKRYRQPLRVELPEDQTNKAHEAGAWL
jgi:hypothetical protein